MEISSYSPPSSSSLVRGLPPPFVVTPPFNTLPDPSSIKLTPSNLSNLLLELGLELALVTSTAPLQVRYSYIGGWGGGGIRLRGSRATPSGALVSPGPNSPNPTTTKSIWNRHPMAGGDIGPEGAGRGRGGLQEFLPWSPLWHHNFHRGQHSPLPTLPCGPVDTTADPWWEKTLEWGDLARRSSW